LLTIKTFDSENVLAISGDEQQLASLISNQPNEINFTEIEFFEFQPLAQKSLQGQFQLKLLEKELKTQIDAINGQSPDLEIMTWAKQESEARALVADEETPTPMIDSLIKSRDLNETRLELAEKIIAAADHKATLIADCLGKYQAERRKLFE